MQTSRGKYLTNKNLEQFEEWYPKNHKIWITKYDFFSFDRFYSLPFEMKIGVYLAYLV